MSRIQPIQTKYSGCNFRSRTEARWAVFFDHLGIYWEYEVEGYDINGRWYLPDFWLPDVGCFVEIKPEKQEDMNLYSEFTKRTGYAIILIEGYPWNYEATFYGWDTTDSGGGLYEDECIFSMDSSDWCGVSVRNIRQDRTIYVSEWETSQYLVGSDLNDEYWEMFKNCMKIELENEINAARSARFEHGESGSNYDR